MKFKADTPRAGYCKIEWNSNEGRRKEDYRLLVSCKSILREQLCLRDPTNVGDIYINIILDSRR
jgi:hypothetical protein